GKRIHVTLMPPPDLPRRKVALHLRASPPRPLNHAHKRLLSLQRVSPRNRRVRARFWHCDATRSDRFRPNNDKFPSFRHGDVRLAQVNRFERWQRKAVLRFSRKSGEHWSRGETNYGALKLRERIRGKDWHCHPNRVEFRFQFGL